MFIKKNIKNIIRISIFVIIIFILFIRLRDENLKQYFTIFFNFNFILISFIALSLLSITSILRWKIILEIISDKNILLKSLFKPGYYSYLSDQINIIGFFASRSVYIPKNINLSTSLLSSLIEKISSFCTKGIFCVPGLIFIYLNIESFFIKNYLNLILLIFIFLIIFLFLIFFSKIINYLKIIMHKYNFSTNFNKKNIFLLIIYSVLIQIIIQNLMYYIHIQFDTSIPYSVFYLLASVSFFASSLPISISQWGLREVSFFIVFSSFIEGNILIITSLIYGATVLFYFIFCNIVILISDIIFKFFQKSKSN